MRKVALITGSSRGIGRACAEALAKDGWAVCINCVERADLAAEFCDKLCSEGFDAIWVQADVADADAVKAMVLRIEKELGKITLLVNNAGIAKQQLFQDIDRATWDRVFAVNLGGCYNTIQAVLPSMLHEHLGCIINMSSIWGRHGASCEVSYSATKHAIIGLTRSLAAELVRRRWICWPGRSHWDASAPRRRFPARCAISRRLPTSRVRSCTSTGASRSSDSVAWLRLWGAVSAVCGAD